MSIDISRHEVLHVTRILADIIERHLADHPAIVGNADWKATTDQVVELLAHLYQKIGAVAQK